MRTPAGTRPKSAGRWTGCFSPISDSSAILAGGSEEITKKPSGDCHKPNRCPTGSAYFIKYAKASMRILCNTAWVLALGAGFPLRIPHNNSELVSSRRTSRNSPAKSDAQAGNAFEAHAWDARDTISSCCALAARECRWANTNCCLDTDSRVAPGPVWWRQATS